MTTRPEELFTPAERAAAEALIFQRLQQLGAPADVIQATRAHMTFLEVGESAHKRLREAAPDLYRAWDDLSLLDPGTTRSEIDAWIAAAQHEPAAAYHLGFAQAVVMLRIQLASMTGRHFD